MNIKTTWQIFIMLASLAVLVTMPPASAQKALVARKYIDAQKAFNSGNLVQAEQLWKECIKENEDNNMDALAKTVPYRGLLVTYQKAKRFEDALAVAEQNIALLKEGRRGQSLDMVIVLKYKEQLLRSLGRTSDADEVERQRDSMWASLPKSSEKNDPGFNAILQYKKEIITLVKDNWHPANPDCCCDIELTINYDGSKRISSFFNTNISKQCMDEYIEVIRKIKAPPFNRNRMGETITVKVTSQMLERR